jgi:hypothetical protein
MCILYPFSAGGAVLPQNVNFNLIAQSFHGAIAAELAKAGLDVRMPIPGAPDQGIVLRGQFVKADPGKRWMRYFLTWLPGAAAVMEVEGWVADGDVPVTQFHSVGKRNIGALGGDSQGMLDSAAKLAGQRVAQQAMAALAQR